MKKLLVIAIAAAMLSSCAMVQAPVGATMFTKVNAPLAVTGNQGASKVGKAECKSILGIIATGDCSIQAASQKAGITSIHHVDYEASNILGIIAKFTVVVYGE